MSGVKGSGFIALVCLVSGSWKRVPRFLVPCVLYSTNESHRITGDMKFVAVPDDDNSRVSCQVKYAGVRLKGDLAAILQAGLSQIRNKM